MKRHAFLSLLLLAVLAGCGSDGPTGPESVSIQGTWTGITSGVNIRMTFAAGSEAVVGNGSFTGPGLVLPLTINGTRLGVDLNLTLSSPGFEPTIFTGTIISATSISGQLNGSGFVNTPVSMTKS